MATPAETTLHRPGDGDRIYAELAAAWKAEGRTVPGQPDPSWDILVAGSGRHSRRSSSQRKPTSPTRTPPER